MRISSLVHPSKKEKQKAAFRVFTKEQPERKKKMLSSLPSGTSHQKLLKVQKSYVLYICIGAIQSIGNDVPGVGWTVLEVPNANLVSLLAASSLDAQGQAVVGRPDRKTSVDSLDFPLLVDGAVGLAHVALSSRLGSRVIRDLESSIVFTINDAEVSKSVGNESPFLVGVIMVLPNNELAALMWISTGIQRQVSCLGQSDSVLLVGNWVERALVLSLVSIALLTLLSLPPTLLPLLSLLALLSPTLLSLLSLSPSLLSQTLLSCLSWNYNSLLSPTLLGLLTLLSPSLLSLQALLTLLTLTPALLSQTLLSLLSLGSPTLLALLPLQSLLSWDSESLLSRNSKSLLAWLAWLALLPWLSPTLLALLSLLSPALLPLLALSPALSFPTHLDMFIKLSNPSQTSIIPNRPNPFQDCFL